MAKYTIELDTMLRDKNFILFNFDYDFYTDNVEIKKKFEQKFIDRYRFNEIGFETVARFKHYLKTSLNEIAPYYKQLYESELRCNDIDFMLNKDYTETFIKNIDSLSKSTETQNSNYNDLTNESNINDGVSDVELTKGNLTSVTGNENTSTSNGTGTSENKQSESYTLTGQGNIGVTSSAELLQKWREVMINIDEMILNDLADLFMSIY